jgi:hypothetical protein
LSQEGLPSASAEFRKDTAQLAARSFINAWQNDL